MLPGILIAFFLALNFPGFSQNGTLVGSAEAEDGELLGGSAIQTSISGYSGTGYVGNIRNSGDGVIVTVSVPETAFYAILIRYHSATRKIQNVNVNDTGASQVEFPGSSGWEFADAGKYMLNEGENIIKLTHNWGWTEIDRFDVHTTTLNNYDDVVSELVIENSTVAARSVYNYILSHYGERIISGQTDGVTYYRIKELTGQSPLYKVWDFQHYTEGYPYLWRDGGHTFGANPNARNVENAIDWYNNSGRKGIVGFQWHWHSPAGGQVSTNTFYTSQTTFDVREAVKEGTPEYDLIIRDIDAIAVQLKKFQSVNIPVLWRPLHEAGGGWFWWGAKGPEACLKLYDIIFDRMTNHHQLDNLIWVWSTPESDWYPGNEKVDIVGHDSYPGNYNYSTQKNIFDIYHELTGGKKIVAMTENGPIPNIDTSLDYDAPWSLFASWYNLVFEQNSDDHLIEVYNNPRVITIEKDTFPRILSTANGSVCDSGTVTLEAESNFGEVNWYAAPAGGEILHTGESFITPEISETTTYYIEASYNGSYSIMNRIAVTAKVYEPVGASIIEGFPDVCQGDTGIIYTIPADENADTYTWTVPEGATYEYAGSTSSISVNFGENAQSGSIVATGENVCGAVVAGTFHVNVNEIPATPFISLNDTVLQSDAPEGNQWYLNGSIIQNATSHYYANPQEGKYYTIVTINGCSSDPSNVISIGGITGSYKLEDNKFRIYPNPLKSGNTGITIYGIDLNSNVLISLFDLHGRKIYSGELTGTEFVLDKSIAPGIYLIRIAGYAINYSEKLIFL